MTDHTDNRALIERLLEPTAYSAPYFDIPHPIPIQKEAAAALTAAQARIEALEASQGQLINDTVQMGMARDAAWTEAIEAAARAQEAALRKGVNPEKHSDHIRALKKGQPK